MPAKAVISFDKLPLFVRNDNHLAEAIVGPDAELKQTWLASLPTLEAHGFPKKVGYGRYRPAVKEFYDRFCLFGTPPLPGTGAKFEDSESWTRPKRRGFKRPTDKR
ncbi:hypothetical protein ASG51_20265 [Methylobacterium sp. Leaf465]|uniref:hypothetical protein n=1 Tax=Methylobacterium sp. Leaf465 TaxID=1736385 RepID=UPI0006F38D32|nr:hypothetical protein [Methylobacterium sp. Leaf465]KQT82083.1 hypothetical protein ASG51_20265 [Methylobacterium sp. Leaf465]